MMYRYSHAHEEKGISYEENYTTNIWDKYIWENEQAILQKILERYFKTTDIHLLDFACGTGRITSFLENFTLQSTGIDVSSSMLKIAQDKLKKTKLVQADLITNPVFKKESFNLITAFRFFVNADDKMRTQAVTTLANLLKKDGLFIFNNHQNESSPFIKWRSMREKHKNRYYNMLNMNIMIDLVHASKLEVIEIIPIGLFHPPKLPIIPRLNTFIDRIAFKVNFLRQFATNIVTVCRKII